MFAQGGSRTAAVTSMWLMCSLSDKGVRALPICVSAATEYGHCYGA